MCLRCSSSLSVPLPHVEFPSVCRLFRRQLFPHAMPPIHFPTSPVLQSVCGDEGLVSKTGEVAMEGADEERTWETEISSCFTAMISVGKEKEHNGSRRTTGGIHHPNFTEGDREGGCTVPANIIIPLPCRMLAWNSPS